MKSLEALEVQCTCLPKIATTENGRCYQPYTRGPCECELLLLYIFFCKLSSGPENLKKSRPKKKLVEIK